MGGDEVQFLILFGKYALVKCPSSKKMKPATSGWVVMISARVSMSEVRYKTIESTSEDGIPCGVGMSKDSRFMVLSYFPPVV